VNFVKIKAVNATFDFGAYVNLHLYFPHYCPVLIKFGTRYLIIILVRIHDFQQNWCREDHTFFTSICIPISFSVSPLPPLHLHSSHLAKVWQHFIINVMAVMVIGNYQYGQVTSTVHSNKHYVTLSFFPPQKL